MLWRVLTLPQLGKCCCVEWSQVVSEHMYIRGWSSAKSRSCERRKAFLLSIWETNWPQCLERRTDLIINTIALNTHTPFCAFRHLRVSYSEAFMQAAPRDETWTEQVLVALAPDVLSMWPLTIISVHTCAGCPGSHSHAGKELQGRFCYGRFKTYNHSFVSFLRQVLIDFLYHDNRFLWQCSKIKPNWKGERTGLFEKSDS